MGLGIAPWIELGRNIIALATKPSIPPSGATDGEELWEGPDDLWPEEETKEESHISETPSEPEIVVTKQWGLKLPGGMVAWNGWQGHSFQSAIDRLKVIASLQKTALDVGYTPENSEEFLIRYSWVTRQMIAQVVYQETEAYELTDTTVSEMEE